MGSVSRSVSLAAPADAVWARAVTFDGINDEFAPLLRMTVPRGLGAASLAAAEPGAALGRSWLLLGGLLPVEWDDMRLAEIGSRRFRERSSMASMSRWEHERTVEPAGTGACVLTDLLGFELRRPLRWIPGAGWLSERIVRAVFAHRHRRLERAHGVAAGGSAILAR